MNMTTDKKYLFISDWCKFLSEKANLLLNTCLGLAWESNSFNEKVINECIFMNRIPELVEKKDPPIITKIKNTNERLDGTLFLEIPTFDILLVKESNILVKLDS